MKKTLAAVLTGALLLIPVSTQAKPHITRGSYCQYARVDHHAGLSIPELKLTIACGVRHFPVSGGYAKALRIAERESGLYAPAVNPSSGACGIYQDIPRYWSGRLASFQGARPRFRVHGNCFDGRANILVNIWLIWKYGWGPWGG